ncbi:unnamed protein product [Fusarium venenatum]|uniref:Uncharacterized protein n=1 Tax=Fusarium venenatum TaxID=56646 RepID=A0A2L2SWZ9_9HYPO|nr:uncharacterized protein FVRRES_05575 [Fusarium venenatum]CEI61139.1 unnamed protein product [Fusarium venenatum]
MTKLIAALFLYFLPICIAASKCYYPNGIEANDFPCDPGADESTCCGGGLGTVCLSNKLYIGTDGNTLRGSCTDKNWASPECAMYCLEDGVGAVLVMTVVYILWRIRKNKKATEKEKQLPPTYYGPGTDTSWQQHHYALGVKEFTPQPLQELHGQALQGYNVRAELPAHN